MHFCTFVLQKKLSEIAVLAALAIPFVSAFNQICYTKSSAACREQSFENRFDKIFGSSSVATAFQQRKSKHFFALPDDSEEVDVILKEAQSAINAAEEALQVAKLPDDSKEVDAILREALSAVNAAEEARQVINAAEEALQVAKLTDDSKEVDAIVKEVLSAINAAEEALQVAKDNAASITKPTISRQTQYDAIAAATAGAALGA
eukprot:CAMPEP_0172415208 /NCGR_PEP_ID=MMETSP1064-20121228/1682_1 /TAXON_ID=202472 /ORGANISM="Aulacoseira subarctica , Strain CCAP 1002/5" /LENGTH=204 /DNA_ID=CAMNT_0013152121 /DNA_START=55 /DNA_END=665 /DNA_ORIENTATION=-